MEGDRSFSRKQEPLAEHFDSPPPGRDHSPHRSPERRRRDPKDYYRGERPPFRDRQGDEHWKRGHSPPHKRIRRDTHYEWYLSFIIS
jgi:hypothetical protein